MEADRAADAAAIANWAPANNELAGGGERILYMASTGCQWRFLPKDFPPYSTVQGYFYEWSRSGLFMTINHALVMDAREKAGARQAQRRRD